MPRYLFIVSRGHLELYHSLRQRFSDDPKAEVILDRREGQRRAAATIPPSERRRGDRRSRPQVDTELREHSHVILSVPAADEL
ncbi:MAG: hypothetical protein ACREA0_24585 [bacterium]